MRSRRADRTPDPFITSEVLYQLSYVGVLRRVARPVRREPAPVRRRRKSASSASCGWEVELLEPAPRAPARSPPPARRREDAQACRRRAAHRGGRVDVTTASAPTATATRSRYHAVSSSSAPSRPRSPGWRRTSAPQPTGRASRVGQVEPLHLLLGLGDTCLTPATVPAMRDDGRGRQPERLERRGVQRRRPAPARAAPPCVRAASSGSSSRSGAVEAAAGHARQRRDERSAASSRRLRSEHRVHGLLGEAVEGHELAARADRLGERPEIVGDKDDHRVRRRLLEILEKGVGGSSFRSVRPETRR